MRQVAVRPDRQGMGIGTSLVGYSETFARSHGFRNMMLHARETVVPFYLRLGYRKVGAMFLEATLPHFEMRKALAD